MTYRPFGVWRTVLALLVIVQHVGWTGPVGTDWGWMATGSTAVLAFFALSGFVITEAAEWFYQGRPGAFMLNRVIRILPQYLLALALSVAVTALVLRIRPEFLPNPLVQATPEQLFAPKNLVMNPFKVLPGMKEGPSFVPYVWALRVEIVFYLLLAGTIWLAARQRAATYPALAAAGAVMFVAFLAGKGPDMFHFAPYFAFGVTAYCATSRPSVVRYLALAGLFGLCLWTYVNFSIPQAFPRSFTTQEAGIHVALFAVLMLAPVVLARCQVAGRWKHLDRRIGDLSYPIYLQQYVVLVLAYALLPRSYWTMGGVFVAALAIGWLSDAVLERFLRRLRDRIRGRELETLDLTQTRLTEAVSTS